MKHFVWAAAVFSTFLTSISYAQVESSRNWPFASRLEGGGPRYITVCLHRSVPALGFGPAGPWRADIFEKQPGCELVVADLSEKQVGLRIEGFTRRGGYQAGTADVYCDPRQTQIPEACRSQFFMRSQASGGSYAILASSEMRRALDESGFWWLVDRAEEKYQAEQTEDALREYRLAYLNIKSLADLNQFAKKYRDNDPENLMSMLENKRLEIENRDAAAAVTDADLKQFIAAYEGNDPAGAVPPAKMKLAELAKAAAAEKQKKAQNELDASETQVLTCKRLIVRAEEVMAHEKQIGLLSGYENKQLLHSAGEQIVDCRAALPKMYARYRSLGGKKPYAALH